MRSSFREIAIISLIVAATAASFYPVRSNGFINYDDPGYITRNERIESGFSLSTIGWAFTTTEQSNWHPVTWISLAIDSSLFGENAAAYHLMALAIHTFTSALLFILLARITNSVWPPAFVALVFAIHPLHVESVAWAAERKDVLCALFWILSLWAFFRFRAGGKRAFYALSLVSFAVALMSKPMAVTLPITLLLLDYWSATAGGASARITREKVDRHRFVSSWKEMLPFFALSFASSAITFIVQQRGGAMENLASLSLWEKLTNAAVSYERYLRLTFYPSGLAIFYPHPSAQLPGIELAVAISLIGLISYASWRLRSRHPYLLIGWIWFIVTLLPVIGLVQVGLQGMADRYMYVPLIGVAIMVAWGVQSLLPAGSLRRTLPGAAFIIAVGLMCAQTAAESALWKDSRTIFRSALMRTTDNYVAHNNYGVDLADSSRHAEAIPHFEEALRILPGYMPARLNYSRSLLAVGDNSRAIENYQWMLHHGWDDPALYALTGKLLEKNGDDSAASVFYAEAIARNPADADTRCTLARVYADRGNFGEARRLCGEALKIEPGNSRAHDILGIVAGRTGDLDAARREFEQAIALDSANADAYNDLGILCNKTGDAERAIGLYEKAVRLDPSHWGAQFNLGKLYTMKERYDSARVHLLAAIQIDPSKAIVRYAYGSVLEAEKDFAGAAREYSEALRLAPSSLQAKNALERVQKLLP